MDALVDTGSSITLISKQLFEKIRKELQRLGIKVTKANYKIQGISGELMEVYGEIKDIPVRFRKNGQNWNLCVGITDKPFKDIVIGINMMKEYSAIVDIGNEELIFKPEKRSKETVKLFLEYNKNPIVAMAKRRKKPYHTTTKRFQPEAVANATPMQEDEWPCKRGMKPRACLEYRIAPDIATEPCEKCAPAYTLVEV